MKNKLTPGNKSLDFCVNQLIICENQGERFSLLTIVIKNKFFSFNKGNFIS
jgi:hypothetical protein